DSDALPRLGQSLEALGRSAAGPVVKPVANSRRREQPGDAGPARGALVEHADCDRTETEAVGGAGRDHQAVERREQLRPIGHVALEAEFDALANAGGDEVGDITLEAVLARRALLEQRGLAGIAKRAARARILLEHRDLVSLGDQRRVGEAGRAGADHRNALAARRVWIGEHRLAAGGAVDYAADARAAAHLVDAGVAGEAAPDRLV